ncbi:hypothetical protein LCGC14_1762060 [marine sediment metagenome]|uniref:Uncharacterized protein n=1 Tax=marine sediment metagenome TaxID=412755 RepID=A0A0F9H0P1_9ZZZZ
MEKEFNLSEKIDVISSFGEIIRYLKVSDIKEFFKRIDKIIRNPKLSRMGMIERIDKLAGEKLL